MTAPSPVRHQSRRLALLVEEYVALFAWLLAQIKTHVEAMQLQAANERAAFDRLAALDFQSRRDLETTGQWAIDCAKARAEL